jgi:3-oxoacyl-[acyl-carrier protein] reductase
LSFGLEGKVALVTASGRGLGNAISRRLAEQGASIVINSRSKRDLDVLLGDLSGASNCEHYAFCSDLTEDGSPEALIEYLREKRLQPDIIVHNLGGNLGFSNPFSSIKEWHQVMRVNLDVAIIINNFLLPNMIEKKWGRVCHISSISALENQGPPSYCAAKAALTAYVRSLGRYVARDGIVMTSVLPGAVFTEGGYWDDASRERPEHVEKYLKERMAIQRFGRPEEIADVVSFLCSPQCSFCVGSALVVDGGQGRSFYVQE